MKCSSAEFRLIGSVVYSNITRFKLSLKAIAISAGIVALRGDPTLMPTPPSLPVVVKNVLPGEGWSKGIYQLHGPAVMFDSWKATRRQLSALSTGTTVTMIEGLSEVVTPDIIRIESAVPRLGLSPGDRLLRYTKRGEGDADFWAKGYWFTDADLGFVQEADGSGCHSGCKAREIKTGQKLWWFHIRLADGRAGWTNAFNSLNPN